MLFGTASKWNEALRSLHQAIPLWLSYPVDALLVLVILLLLWRLWRFTLMPYWRPDEPQEIPYWIPSETPNSTLVWRCPNLISLRYENDDDDGGWLIDSLQKAMLFRFFEIRIASLRTECKLDIIAFLLWGSWRLGSSRQLFGNSFEPFAITIAGTKYYILSSAVDATAFYNNASTLSWDSFLRDCLTGFGVNPKRLDKLWCPSTTRSEINPSGKNIINLTEELYRKHLLPGENFEVLMSRLKQNLEDYLSHDRVFESFGHGSGNSTQKISLLQLCGDVLINVTQAALFDPVLFRIDPTMTAGMQTFTDELWKLLYPCPGIDAREVKALRSQYHRAFLSYMRLPKEARTKEAWMISTLIDQYREFNIDEDDAASMMVMVYWT